MPGSSDAVRTALAGRYQVERELGQGGMATVYLARDLKHHRQVAIKVLKPELAAQLGADRFLREIDTVAGLTHPHILPLHDSGKAAGFLYFVMPYVAGESLRDRLARERQLPVDEALQIAREVADALGHAHGHGVVHRDVNPANILLESGHAVVADFGIARAVTAAGGETLTETGTVVGTPAYMSPEQASGRSPLDSRSDLYSLGCVLYEMLAGQPPFTGPTAESVAHQHLTAVPRPVSELRPSVPASVVAVLQRALAKAPADRFSTAAQFAEALAHGDVAYRHVAEMSTAPPVPEARPARRPAGPGRRWRLAALLAGAVACAGAGAWVLLRPGGPARAPTAAVPAHPRSAVAVLPPQNLSASGPHAYFASGLHDELLTQLAKVASLTVISRTSVMGYQGTTKPLRQIADELGVGSIVEGSVQVMDGRLRVNVQLIDAATDRHVWAERYDRTLDDAFAVQSEIAQAIVTAVGATLNAEERSRVTAAPTANAEAYRLYLQGREHYLRPGYLQPNFKIAQQFLERAVALDPGFALARAALSMVHGVLHWFRYDPSPARAARQREEAETALRLAPDLPQAHIAMGIVHYQGRHDYRRALDEFVIAQRSLPNDADLLGWMGYAHRRLGQWDEASAAFERATRLDPRSADLFWDLGGDTYCHTRRYDEAVRAYDEAVRLAPDVRRIAVHRASCLVQWQGRLDPLREVLDRPLPDADRETSLLLAAERPTLLLWERNADGLLLELRRAPFDVLEDQGQFQPTALYAAWAHQLRGDRAAARAAFEVARVRLDAALRELPDDDRIHAARGLALAGLGRRDDALDEARWLQQSVFYRADAYFRSSLAVDRALILAQAGEADGALDEIERLLAGPSRFSVHLLRLDPRWDPIRDHPRFKALVAKYGVP
jgi:serine/threonine-protein kinase